MTDKSAMKQFLKNIKKAEKHFNKVPKMNLNPENHLEIFNPYALILKAALINNNTLTQQDNSTQEFRFKESTELIKKNKHHKKSEKIIDENEVKPGKKSIMKQYEKNLKKASKIFNIAPKFNLDPENQQKIFNPFSSILKASMNTTSISNAPKDVNKQIEEQRFVEKTVSKSQSSMKIFETNDVEAIKKEQERLFLKANKKYFKKKSIEDMRFKSLMKQVINKQKSPLLEMRLKSVMSNSNQKSEKSLEKQKKKSMKQFNKNLKKIQNIFSKIPKQNINPLNHLEIFNPLSGILKAAIQKQ